MIKKTGKGAFMLKNILFFCMSLLIAPCVLAQEVFWGYDEDNKELIVPPECDGVQEADELYEVGMRLFEETGYAKQGSSYCLLAAAMENHPAAQFQIAHMYHKGILLPKSDLAAYKWATLAALNGNEDGDKLGASIEQFLSIDDIEAATKSLDALIPVIAENTTKVLSTEKEKQTTLKTNIKAVNAEVRDLKKYGRIQEKTILANKAAAAESETTTEQTASKTETPSAQTPANKQRPALFKERTNTKERAKANESIFSDRDLENVPLPSAS